MIGGQVEDHRSVGDGRFDLAAVAHDAGVAQHSGDVIVVEPCHHLGVEAGERLTEVVALAKNREP